MNGGRRMSLAIRLPDRQPYPGGPGAALAALGTENPASAGAKVTKYTQVAIEKTAISKTKNINVVWVPLPACIAKKRQAAVIK